MRRRLLFSARLSHQARALRRRLKPYMLRRRKEDVTKDIPPKEETIIDVELTMVQKKYYRAIYERNHSVLNKVYTVWKRERLSCCWERPQSVAQLLCITRSGHACVVFATRGLPHADVRG